MKNHGNLRRCTMDEASRVSQGIQSTKRVRDLVRCRIDASESLPKSAVSSARFLPGRKINFKNKNMEYHKRPTNARNVQTCSSESAKMAPLPIHWPACPTHATNQEAECPTSCSRRSACNECEPKQQKVRKKKKAPKKPAIHLHAFQDVRVFAAALDADADPSLLENDLPEDS